MYTYVRALITQANEMRTRPFVLSRVNSEGAAFFLLCHGGPSWKARPGNLFKVIFEGRLRRQFCTEHISKHLARTFSGFFYLKSSLEKMLNVIFERSFIYRYTALKAVQTLGFTLHMYTYGGGKIFCNNLQALTLSFLRCTIFLSHTRLHTLAWLGRNKDPTTYTSSCGTVLSLTALSTSKTASMTIQ